jgi:hypothetical protein
MTKETPAVKAIVLTIGKKEIELTPLEVKALKEALEEMYPSPARVVERTVYRDNWWSYPSRPYITWTASGLNSSNTNNALDLYKQASEQFTKPMLSLEAKY